MQSEYPIFKAAAVQSAPVFLDLDGTIAKACALIREAGKNGAKLIGFPEAYVPGYPAWISWSSPAGASAELFARLYKNAVEIPSKSVKLLSEAARDADIYVCISVTERERGSLYLAQLWFDPSGALVAKHRKLKPTGAERYIWGEGDGSTMPVLKSPIGNLGGLQCWEHLMPLASAAMSYMNEQVHIASWPVVSSGGTVYSGMRDFREKTIGKADPAMNPMVPSEIMSRHYALSTQTFVLMCTQMMGQDAIDILSPFAEPGTFKLGGGNSKIIAPDGVVISAPVAPGEEGLAYADIPLEMVVYAKYMCDPGGHYSVPHVLSLKMNQNPAPVVAQVGQPPLGSIVSFSELQELN